MADDKLINFLSRAWHARWRQPPSVWNDQLREAMSEGLVKVGWGGVLELTDVGKAIVRNAAEASHS